ncbi:MAG: 3-phenylpropionate/cinnamic acid dioxygenase subunit beta [Pseudomonadota bacterium]|nr:3-phenylpropionate/cinnamic acid dioxygenase subunit beta [Pseudomonadota bacterium]
MNTAAASMDRPWARAAAEQLLTPWAQGASVEDGLLRRVERFLHKEARLLDLERYREWYALLAEDLFYWMPLRENRQRRDSRRELEPDNVAFFDERKADIDVRLQRLESGKAWIEDPAGRHVYAITNIEAFETDTPGELEVLSVFTLYRNRSLRDESMLMGRRRDVLRSVGADFQIARRLILLQQALLLTKNLSVFF